MFSDEKTNILIILVSPGAPAFFITFSLSVVFWTLNMICLCFYIVLSQTKIKTINGEEHINFAWHFLSFLDLCGVESVINIRIFSGIILNISTALFSFYSLVSQCCIVTEQKWRFGCRLPQSQTCEADAGAKGKRFYSSAAWPGRMADFCLKDCLLFFCHGKSPTLSSKASVQSSCSILKHSCLEP